MAAAMMVADFLDYLRRERNYSLKTVQSYGDDLVKFESYFTGLDTSLSWESVDSDVIRDWMESMMDEGGSASSICRRLSALRSFYRFALSHGLVAHDPARGVSGPKRGKPLPKFVREDDMERLLDWRMWGRGLSDVRARTIILLFYETGLRVSELVSLDDSMVDTVSMQLKVTGKRNKERMVPFGAEMLEALEAYMRLRDESVARMSPALFVTDKGLRMNVRQVQYLVAKHLSRVTTQNKRSPHVLRHTFATAMLNHDAGIESVKKLLGHEKLSTTEIYTHTTFEQLKKVYKSAHPRA